MAMHLHACASVYADVHAQGVSPLFHLQPKTADAHKNGRFERKNESFIISSIVLLYKLSGIFFNFLKCHRSPAVCEEADRGGGEETEEDSRRLHKGPHKE